MSALPAILLVDDDSTTNFLNERLLRRMNASQEVQVALNGQQALDMLRTNCQAESKACPSLVLLDVNMPVMNGFEFLEAFTHLSLAKRQEIVVVVLSSSQLEQDLARVQQLPVAEFIHKPLTREKVTEVLARYFNHPAPSAN
jgi:CheY-like chemotaxis protein